MQMTIYCRRGIPNRLLVSDIKQEWGKRISPLGTEPVSIFLFANAAKDPEATLEQDFGGSPPYTRGNASDDYRWHEQYLLENGPA
jgi:hypothetical protein